MAAYDEEAKYFDGGVRTAKRRELRARLITALRPAAAAHLGHCATKLMQRLKAGAYNHPLFSAQLEPFLTQNTP